MARGGAAGRADTKRRSKATVKRIRRAPSPYTGQRAPTRTSTPAPSPRAAESHSRLGKKQARQSTKAKARAKQNTRVRAIRNFGNSKPLGASLGTEGLERSSARIRAKRARRNAPSRRPSGPSLNVPRSRPLSKAERHWNAPTRALAKSQPRKSALEALDERKMRATKVKKSGLSELTDHLKTIGKGALAVNPVYQANRLGREVISHPGAVAHDVEEVGKAAASAGKWAVAGSRTGYKKKARRTAQALGIAAEETASDITGVEKPSDLLHPKRVYKRGDISHPLRTAEDAIQLGEGMVGAAFQAGTSPKQFGKAIVKDEGDRWGKYITGKQSTKEFRRQVRKNTVPYAADLVSTGVPISRGAMLGLRGAIRAAGRDIKPLPHLQTGQGVRPQPLSRGVVGTATQRSVNALRAHLTNRAATRTGPGRLRRNKDWRAKRAKAQSAQAKGAVQSLFPKTAARARGLEIGATGKARRSYGHADVNKRASQAAKEAGIPRRKLAKPGVKAALNARIEAAVETPKQLREYLSKRIEQIRAAHEERPQAMVDEFNAIPDMEAAIAHADELMADEGIAMAADHGRELGLRSEAEDPTLAPEQAELRKDAPLVMTYGDEFPKGQTSEADRVYGPDREPTPPAPKGTPKGRPVMAERTPHTDLRREVETQGHQKLYDEVRAAGPTERMRIIKEKNQGLNDTYAGAERILPDLAKDIRAGRAQRSDIHSRAVGGSMEQASWALKRSRELDIARQAHKDATLAEKRAAKNAKEPENAALPTFKYVTESDLTHSRRVVDRLRKQGRIGPKEPGYIHYLGPRSESETGGIGGSMGGAALKAQGHEVTHMETYALGLYRQHPGATLAQGAKKSIDNIVAEGVRQDVVEYGAIRDVVGKDGVPIQVAHVVDGKVLGTGGKRAVEAYDALDGQGVVVANLGPDFVKIAQDRANTGTVAGRASARGGEGAEALANALDHHILNPEEMAALRDGGKGADLDNIYLLDADVVKGIKTSLHYEAAWQRHMRSVLKTFPSMAILGMSPTWLIFQYINNASLLALNGVKPGFKGVREFAEEARRIDPALWDKFQGRAGLRTGQTDIGGHAHPQAHGVAEGTHTADALLRTWDGARQAFGAPVRGMFGGDLFNNFASRTTTSINTVKVLKRFDDIDHGFVENIGLFDRIRANTRDLSPAEFMDYVGKNPQNFERAAAHTDTILGNFNRFTGAERGLLHNNFLFYGFLRFSVRFALHTLPIGHPLATSILANMSNLHEREIRDLVGAKPDEELPFGSLGNFYSMKDGKYEAAGLNMSRLNPLMNTLFNAIEHGNPGAVLGSLSPMHVELLQQATGVSLFKGTPLKIGQSSADIRGGSDTSLGGFLSGARNRMFLNHLITMTAPGRIWFDAKRKGRRVGEDWLPGREPIKYAKGGEAAKREAARRKLWAEEHGGPYGPEDFARGWLDPIWSIATHAGGKPLPKLPLKAQMDAIRTANGDDRPSSTSGQSSGPTHAPGSKAPKSMFEARRPEGNLTAAQVAAANRKYLHPREIVPAVGRNRRAFYAPPNVLADSNYRSMAKDQFPKLGLGKRRPYLQIEKPSRKAAGWILSGERRKGRPVIHIPENTTFGAQYGLDPKSVEYDRATYSHEARHTRQKGAYLPWRDEADAENFKLRRGVPALRNSPWRAGAKGRPYASYKGYRRKAARRG